LDLVVAVSTEGCDEEGGIIIKGIVVGDGEEEVSLNILVLGAPDFFTAFVDNSVLVRVVGDGSGTQQGSEEVREELGFRGDREWKVGKDGSRWGGRGNNGDGGFNNGRREIFYGDVCEGNSLDNFFELEMDVFVLILGGQGILKLRAFDVSLLGGNIGEDVKEVGRGGNNGGWGAGAIGVASCGEAITTWAGVVLGVVWAIQVFLDDLIGSGDIDLIGVVDLRPVGNGKGRGDNKGW
jgi:hypothetical protein